MLVLFENYSVVLRFQERLDLWNSKEPVNLTLWKLQQRNLPLPVLQSVPSGQRAGNRLLPLHELQCLYGPVSVISYMPGKMLWGQLPNLPRVHLHIQQSRKGSSVRALDALDLLPSIWVLSPFFDPSMLKCLFTGSLHWSDDYRAFLFPGVHLFSLYLPDLQQVARGHAGRWLNSEHYSSSLSSILRFFTK